LIAMTSTRTSLTAAALAIAALGLAACAIEPHRDYAPPLTPGAQYAPRTEAGDDGIALALRADGLSGAQLQALKALAARRADVGGGVVTLRLPHGPADAAAAARTADAAQAVLAAGGALVVRTTYDSDDPKAPLLVSFAYTRAVVPHCGRWDDLTATYDNESYANFGCAVNANMAAQIARPSDIDHPRTEDAPDSGRRLTVLDKYRDGKVTSQDEPQIKASISHIGE
jgi:pilus assembly protein CpaD